MKILKFIGTIVIMIISTIVNAQSDVPLTMRAQFNGSYG